MTWQMPLPFTPPAQNEFAASRGLIVRSPWAEQILEGTKSWEIRGAPTKVRGRIAIIRAQSKMVFGYCDLVDVKGPLTLVEMLESCNLHGMSTEELRRDGLPYPKTYAWCLRNPIKLATPIPYEHPSGAVIWVDLNTRRSGLRGDQGTLHQKNKESLQIS